MAMGRNLSGLFCARDVLYKLSATAGGVPAPATPLELTKTPADAFGKSLTFAKGASLAQPGLPSAAPASENKHWHACASKLVNLTLGRYAGALESGLVEPRLKLVGQGAYLVRDSSTRPGSYTLSVFDQGAPQHIVIHKGDVRCAGVLRQASLPTRLTICTLRLPSTFPTCHPSSSSTRSTLSTCTSTTSTPRFCGLPATKVCCRLHCAVVTRHSVLRCARPRQDLVQACKADRAGAHGCYARSAPAHSPVADGARADRR